tara:strand:- start:689 stop:1027 length:339 start_codon:yes stop_codon:yes gene_type:complete
MSYNENFLFFNEETDAANATGEGALYKSSDFLGANVSDANDVQLFFKSRNGAATDDIVELTMASSDVKQLMQDLAAVLSNPRGGIFYQSTFVGEANGWSSKTISTIDITTQA